MSEYGEDPNYDKFLKEEAKRQEKAREEFDKSIRPKPNDWRKKPYVKI